MKAGRQRYHSRMQRVLDHIDRHLDENLDLDAVSGVAAFGPPNKTRSRLMQTIYTPEDVTIRDVPPDIGGVRGASRRSEKNRCDHPAIHCLAQSSRAVANNEFDL